MAGTLYLVATPIGNLKDISLRAIETLREVDLIACEDTRHSRKLLTHHGISNKLISYHAHNEVNRADEFAKLLANGKSIAVVSDAGTPAINDPGGVLVEKAYEIGAAVVPIPGPVAFVNAAIVSGLSTDSIFFGGFLPPKKGERRRRLDDVKQIPGTLVFYESPHRLGRSLEDCYAVLGDRRAAIVRELTKLHEETVRGGLKALARQFLTTDARGEIVIVIERAGKSGPAVSDISSLAARVHEIEAGGVDRKTALKAAAKEFGISRSEAYRVLQNSK